MRPAIHRLTGINYFSYFHKVSVNGGGEVTDDKPFQNY